MGYHAMPDLSERRSGAGRERLLAVALREVISELRLVDAVDYIAFLRMDVHGNIADILESSSQLHLRPGALSFSSSGEVRASWTTPPVVDLDLVLREGASEIHFRLTLEATGAAIRIDHFPKADASEGEAMQTQRLKHMLEAVRLQRLPG